MQGDPMLEFIERETPIAAAEDISANVVDE
jgi:hypothetical protein